MPMDTDYMFYTQKREKKEKGEKSSEKKMKGMMPMNSSKQRQIRPQCLAIWLNMPNCTKQQATYKNIFVTHQKHQKARSGGTTKEKRKSRWSDKDRLVVAKPKVNGSICLYCPDLVFPQLYITMCSVPTATPHCQLHNCTFSIWIYCMKSEIHCRLNMGLFV